MLWLLILATLGASAFLAYRFNNYLFKNDQPIAAENVRPAVANGPDAAASKRVNPAVDGELIDAAVNVPDAEYPASTNNPDGPSGPVMVLVQVDSAGRVTSARALYGDDELQAAAVQAAKKATFDPKKLATKGKIVTGTITYTFINRRTGAGSPIAKPGAESNTDEAVIVGGPLAGTQIDVPAPDYPASAKRNGIKGAVTVVVRVDRSGKVISWLTLNGDPQLRAAALKAAKKASFSPDKLPSKGEVVGTITYNFKG
jgi:TonB family protein